MSILRLAVVISCAVAVLPSDKLQQAKLYENAVNAAQWAGTYCEREPVKCEQAIQYWDQFKNKAQFAAALGYDALQHYSAVADQAAPGPQLVVQSSAVTVGANPAASAPQIPLAFGRGTLIETDLKPSWRGSAKAR